MRRIVARLALALAVVAAPAFAGRTPATPEKSKIEVAVRFMPAMGRQNAVVFKTTRVSTVDGRYALARAADHDAKGVLLGNDFFLLKRTSFWNVV